MEPLWEMKPSNGLTEFVLKGQLLNPWSRCAPADLCLSTYEFYLLLFLTYPIIFAQELIF